MNENNQTSIVVTGASGFVGRLLIPKLYAAGCRLMLVGRSSEILEKMYPGVPACRYDVMAEKCHGYDMLVHLAGSHAGLALDEGEAQKTNVDLSISVADTAVAAGIPVMLYRYSTHVLEPKRDTVYTRSKREAITKLKAIEGLDVRLVFVPLVHGGNWTGRFSFLNSLPNPIARRLFTALAACKPTCHIDYIADYILDGAPKATMILSDRQINNALYSGMMRLIDLTFAIAVAVLLGWLLAIVWFLIRVGSRGPGLFAQLRVGHSGDVFICYKFRTMYQGTPQAGTHEVSASSITPIGNLLRKTKIDELPQIINIFRNEMSLVGPRPCLPSQIEVMEERFKCGVLDVKPGITGLAQINDVDMSDPVRLAKWDAEYLALRSILLDLKIAMATVLGRGQGDKTIID